jgi:hypothetical protein
MQAQSGRVPRLIGPLAAACVAALAPGVATAEPAGPASLPAEAPPAPTEPNRLWTAVNEAAILGVSAIWYWGYEKRGVPRVMPSDWVDRFGSDVPMLDSNDFITNYTGHSLTGILYHLAARTNDVPIWETALWSLGTSLAWEWVVEFRGKIDVNDIIYTTPVGLGVGEFAHKFGRLLQQQGEGGGWGTARWTLGFFQAFNDTTAGASSPRGPWIDHDLDLRLGGAYGRGSSQVAGDSERGAGYSAYVRFGGTLTGFDDGYPAGRGWQSFSDGNVTSLDLKVGGGSSGFRDTYILSDTLLAGWRYTDIEEGAARGKAVNLGTAAAFRYHRERYGAWREQLSLAHLPGLAADAELWGPGWRLRGLLRLHPDYGGVHVFAYPEWQAAYPDESGMAVIEQHGYLHGFGASARLGAELQVSRLRAGGSLFAGGYRPHHGLDEFRPGREHHEPGWESGTQTTEQDITSRMLDYELWLRGDLPGGAFARVHAAARYRGEQFEEFDSRARAFETGVELGVSF